MEMAEKGKPKAKTAAKKTTKKKTAAKTAGKGKKPTPQKAASKKVVNQEPKDRSALSVLIIMGLVTVIIILLGKFYGGDEIKKKVVVKKDVISSKKNDRNKKEKAHDRKEKKKSPDTLSDKQKKNDKNDKKKDIASTVNVRVYFVKLNEKTEKIYLSSVTRKVDKNKKLNSALNELIKGTSSAEERKGFLTAVPKELRIRSVRVINRIAEIDFNSAIERGAGGNLMVNRLDQIVYTATQFDSVDSVVIKINGRRRSTLGGDGLSIGGPIHRRK